MRGAVLGLSLTVVFFLGCGAIQYRYVGTVASLAPAKAATCDIAVLAAMPSDGEYQEIGIVEPLNRRPTDQIGVFKDLIREDVCLAGGDVVVGELSRGTYVRGVVLRRLTAK